MKQYVRADYIVALIGLIAVAFFSTYKLTESPPIWLDEGVAIQVAQNIATNSYHGVQIAPHLFAPGWYATTSFTVTWPVSFMFSLFGSGILQARSVMVLFILLLYVGAFLLLKNRDRWTLSLGLLLLATFAPLYGQGKNVLGEVPGLAYLLIGLYFLIHSNSHASHKKRALFFSGLFIALSIVTKPIFILLIPAAIISFFIYRKHLFNDRSDLFTIAGVASVIFLGWIFIQFNHAELNQIISLYSNPNHIDVLKTVLVNLRRFFTEPQVVYAAGLFIFWSYGFFVRLKKGGPAVDVAEMTAWIFSLLVYLSYIRTAGFYRYFFIAEILSVIYCIQTAKVFYANKIRICIYVIFSILVAVQLYQTMFSSWVAEYYNSTRTQLFSEYFKKFDGQKSIFFYKVPELPVFLNNKNYYQYFEINPIFGIGTESLEYLKSGVPDFVLISYNTNQNDPIFSKYHFKENIDKYVLMEK